MYKKIITKSFVLFWVLIASVGLISKVEAATQKKSNKTVQSSKKSKIKKALKVPKAPIIPAKPSVGEAAGLHLEPDAIGLKSAVALVIDTKTGKPLFEKNTQAVLPIASLTKLMSAVVLSDAKQSPDEKILVTSADVDLEKNSRSRLPVGSLVSREELLQLALMSSENRASSALARNYPGGKPAFVQAMNKKALSLGMGASHFADASGLSPENTANAIDLLKLIKAIDRYPKIAELSTEPERMIHNGKRPINFGNSNRLIKSKGWTLSLQKTGYTSEAGSCLILLGKVDGRSVTIVLLDSVGRLSKFGDAQRIRDWLSSL